MLERLGAGLFRLSARLLLPGWLHDRAADEMEAIFRARQREAGGSSGLARAWAVEFGGLFITAIRARLHRRRSGASTMESVIQDVRYALRALRRRPTTAVLAVLTFGLGIATSTAMFSVVDAVLIRDLPYPDPDRVVSIYPTSPQFAGHPTLGAMAERATFSWPEFVDLRDNPGAGLESVAILASGGAIVRDADGGAERIDLVRTSHTLFPEVLRIPMQIGRSFTREEQETNANLVVFSDAYWERRFGRDPAVIGRTIVLSGTPHEIIGILPEGFSLAGWEAEGFRPMRADDNRGNHSYYAIGRLTEGTSIERAAEMARGPFMAAMPDDHNQHGLNFFPRQEDETRAVSGPLLLLSAASLVLLLVACGNVAVLLLGAALDREQEIAVRGALGADRRRLAGQLLTESLVIAVAGSFVGLLLTRWATGALVLLAPAGVARIGEAAVDLRVLGFGILATLVFGVLVGLVPALVFSRTDLAGAMTGARGATNAGRARLQGMVVVGEIALATVLVVGAGLLGRTVMALNHVETGFDVERLAGVRLSLPSSLGDGLEGDTAVFLAYMDAYDRVKAAVEAIPGVGSAAYTSVLPLQADRGNNEIVPEGWEGETIVAERRFVSAGFFETMGTRIVEGRSFDATDDRFDAPSTIIVSEGVAEMVWPGESAIGKRVAYWGREPSLVVGVAEDVRDEGVRQGTAFAYYVPRKEAWQSYGSLIVRAEGDLDGVVSAIRPAIAAVDPEIAAWEIETFESAFAAQIASERYRARLVTVFSALAALFALMGVYGVTARSVAARTRELGIRLALGAERARVMGMVVRQALRLAVYGALLGIAVSFAATRAIESFLWGVERTDLLTLVGTALLLGTATVLAALAPGRRAARIDPMEALRAE